MSDKFKFTWDVLGDIELGRPNLGNLVNVAAYRLMQFSLKEVMEEQLGPEEAAKMFYTAGQIAGREFTQNIIGDIEDVNEALKLLQTSLRELGIGVLRFEKVDLEQNELILTVSEDLECSGLPVMDYEMCTYDEGFIASVLEHFYERKFDVKEIDCWCTGDRICRFKAVGVSA